MVNCVGRNFTWMFRVGGLQDTMDDRTQLLLNQQLASK